MTVFVCINTAKQLGDVDYVKVFANVEAAERWFEEHDLKASCSSMTFWSEPDRTPHHHVQAAAAILIVGWAAASEAMESVGAGIIVVFGAAGGACGPNGADQTKSHHQPPVPQRCSARGSSFKTRQ